MDYPAGMVIEEVGDKAIVFTLVGPTQREHTEFSDGIMFTVGLGSFDTGQTLRDYVFAEAEATARDFSVELPLREVAIDDLQGYSFVTHGLGDITTMYFPKQEGGILTIGYSMPDPTDVALRTCLSKSSPRFDFSSSIFAVFCMF